MVSIVRTPRWRHIDFLYCRSTCSGWSSGQYLVTVSRIEFEFTSRWFDIARQVGTGNLVCIGNQV
ncbi:uncharacterized protein METZ01_LOCUS316501 [marine metagenome]|uniref:Uncharacterized protein n=1 Tax=marine metagenome TaxID=408172 RepID=A0A382NTE5_9ZZZZ